jgi:CBS domain-containing protein
MMENMRLRDVMSRADEVVSPDATLAEAAEKLRTLRAGSLPVVDGNRVVGLLSVRDVTVQARAAGLNTERVRVHEVMRRDVVFGYDDESVGEAARKMQVGQVRRMVVLGRDQRIVGVVTLGDLSVRGLDDPAAGLEAPLARGPGNPR